MKQKIITLLVLVVVAIILVLPNSAPTKAEEGVVVANAECPVQRLNRIQEVKIDFYVKLEEQLESADLTSDRLFDLYQDFNEAQTRIKNIATNTINLDLEDSSGEGAAINQTCLLFANSQVDEIEQVFNEYLNQVTTRTRNYLLLEKFDGMNEELRDLQETFRDIQSNLSEFHDQLPCFVSQCVQK